MPKTLNSTLDTLDGRVNRIAGIIDEMKGEEIVVMDLRGICDFTDAFVIATMRSNTHMQAVAASLIEKLRNEGLRPVSQPDMASTRWALLDFSNVLVHLFDSEGRSFYDLEHLWGDAESMPWQPQRVMA